MAKITVRYRGPLKELTLIDEEALDVIAVRDIIKHISGKHGPKAVKLAKAMLIVIDGESVNLRRGFATKLREGETVQFLPICGGG